MEEEAFLDVCKLLRERYKPTVAYMLSQDYDLVKETHRTLADIPLIVCVNVKAAGHELIIEGLKNEGVRVHGVSEALDLDLGILPQARDLMISAHAGQLLKLNDRVLCIIKTTIINWTVYQVKNLRNNRLKEILKGRLPVELLEAVLDLSVELVREGREGYPAGALFIMGDSGQVLRISRIGIANPFQGQSESTRSVMDRKNWRTIKGFASIDGACLIEVDGLVSAAGRYININQNWAAFLKDQDGGGRHSAAIVASQVTKAISVCVSSEGRISVYMDGKKIYSLNVKG